jgi:hypothetical protein
MEEADLCASPLAFVGKEKFPMDDEVVLHGEAIFTYLHRILRSIVG